LAHPRGMADLDERSTWTRVHALRRVARGLRTVADFARCTISAPVNRMNCELFNRIDHISLVATAATSRVVLDQCMSGDSAARMTVLGDGMVIHCIPVEPHGQLSITHTTASRSVRAVSAVSWLQTSLPISRRQTGCCRIVKSVPRRRSAAPGLLSLRSTKGGGVTITLPTPISNAATRASGAWLTWIELVNTIASITIRTVIVGASTTRPGRLRGPSSAADGLPPKRPGSTPPSDALGS
jgi:hypothetical protein